MNVAGITDGATIQLMFHNGSIPSEGHRPPTAKDADKHVLNSVVVQIEVCTCSHKSRQLIILLLLIRAGAGGKNLGPISHDRGESDLPPEETN